MNRFNCQFKTSLGLAVISALGLITLSAPLGQAQTKFPAQGDYSAYVRNVYLTTFWINPDPPTLKKWQTVGVKYQRARSNKGSLCVAEGIIASVVGGWTPIPSSGNQYPLEKALVGNWFASYGFGYFEPAVEQFALKMDAQHGALGWLKTYALFHAAINQMLNAENPAAPIATVPSLSECPFN